MGDRRDGHAREQATVAPGDQAFACEERGRSRQEEGAAALCGNGETQQVRDRPRTDCRGPEPSNVRVMSWEAGARLIPHSGFNHDSLGSSRPGRDSRSSGGVRKWRENPGTGGRTSTASGNISGRRRDWERHS